MRPASLLIALALCLPAAVPAQDPAPPPARLDAQLRRVEAALSRISQEQQSVYQRFQMLQEMRRAELQQVYQQGQTYTPPATPPNYEDLVREKNAHEQRLQQYSEEIDRLYARYRELDAQKQPLLEALSELALQR